MAPSVLVYLTYANTHVLYMYYITIDGQLTTLTEHCTVIQAYLPRFTASHHAINCGIVIILGVIQHAKYPIFSDVKLSVFTYLKEEKRDSLTVILTITKKNGYLLQLNHCKIYGNAQNWCYRLPLATVNYEMNKARKN